MLACMHACIVIINTKHDIAIVHDNSVLHDINQWNINSIIRDPTCTSVYIAIYMAILGGESCPRGHQLPK